MDGCGIPLVIRARSFERESDQINLVPQKFLPFSVALNLSISSMRTCHHLSGLGSASSSPLGIKSLSLARISTQLIPSPARFSKSFRKKVRTTGSYSMSVPAGPKNAWKRLHTSSTPSSWRIESSGRMLVLFLMKSRKPSLPPAKSSTACLTGIWVLGT